MAVDWRLGGVALGLVFFVALMLVKPVGVSTQFVVADGIIANALFDGVIRNPVDQFGSMRLGHQWNPA